MEDTQQYRGPLQHINDNNNNDHQNYNINNYHLKDGDNDISNENVDPSQKQALKNMNNIKSVINNIDDIRALNNMHNNNNNLYLRRFQNNKDSICNNNNNNNNIKNKNHIQHLKVPSLKIDIGQCSNQSIDSLSAINTNPSLFSANSFTQSNDNSYLSSASSIHSSLNNPSLNAYYSHSRSVSEIVPVQKRKVSKNKKNHKKKKSGSLFKKLTNLVTNRRSKTNVDQQQTQESMRNDEYDDDEQDEDGDITINDNSDKNNNNDNNKQQQAQNDDDGIFTPSTGNTPRLIKSTTPLSYDDYNEEIIDSIIGNDTYYEEYIYELFDEEKRNSSLFWYKTDIYNNNEDLILRRQKVIHWIYSVSVKFELQTSTIYRCIYYLDKLCTTKDVNYSHLRILAATVLLLSIKWNEKEEKVPSLYRLNKECNKDYTPNSFKLMEIKVLNLLSFKLKVVLPIDFVSYYIDKGCVFDNDKLDQCYNLHLHQRTTIYIQKFSSFFLDISIQNYRFWQFIPSKLAFAVIIAARRALKIEPYFNPKLINLCNYYPNEITKCFSLLWNEYHTKYPKDARRAEKLQPHNLDKYIIQQNNNNQSRHSF